jgi:hypothetical protein
MNVNAGLKMHKFPDDALIPARVLLRQCGNFRAGRCFELAPGYEWFYYFLP